MFAFSSFCSIYVAYKAYEVSNRPKVVNVEKHPTQEIKVVEVAGHVVVLDCNGKSLGELKKVRLGCGKTSFDSNGVLNLP